jgi:hypothetical protein
MLGKLIVHAPTRAEAIDQLIARWRKPSCWACPATAA